jgi:AP2 domain/HNH endonuclease
LAKLANPSKSERKGTEKSRTARKVPEKSTDSVRRPYKRRTDRNRGLCECGEHVWTVLTQGYVAFVSPEDVHLLQERKWRARRVRNTVYALAHGNERGTTLALHREILGDALGADFVSDHIDQDGLNNRRSNLRPATNQQNLANNCQPRGASGFRGVRLHKRDGCWEAQISGQYLGRFDTPEEAARAYDTAALARFGEFATLNFPPDASRNETGERQ